MSDYFVITALKMLCKIAKQRFMNSESKRCGLSDVNDSRVNDGLMTSWVFLQ